MSDEQHQSVPPLTDFSDREGPAPGPLTRPAPVIRPQKKKRRWAVAVLIAAIVGAIAVAAVAVENAYGTEAAAPSTTADAHLEG
ncbi:hypothetical protein [uncultured Microbacterium sp.]|uniref:hypothetical protein n=1 Tax=uncultured Microbacterium sp. TaxID=191216 RepID=UPI002613E1C2|nr:hypothetical protein [uncultured Microbacterium sp.]